MKNNEKNISGIVFLNKIDEVLTEQGRSRKSLCDKLSILQGTMATWKTKDIMPAIDTIQRIAEELKVSVNWLISNSEDFEKNEILLGQFSRKAIRLRIYKALEDKYKNQDERFIQDFLSNPVILRELHNYYFNDGFLTYEYLLNWSKGRCEIESYFFNQIAENLNTTLQYILTGSELLIPSNANYSKPFDKQLYDLALEYRNELNCLNNLTEDRKQSGITILNQLMRLEQLEYVENGNKSK